MSDLFVIDGVVIKGQVFGDLRSSQTTTARVARKGVLGGRQRHEKIGKGDKKFTLEGKIAPFELGGFPEVTGLEEACDNAVPVFVARGDGSVLGWYTIASCEMSDRHLSGRGIGRVIDVSLELELTLKPDRSAAMTRLKNLMERLGL
jgi:uncharacterized protein